jgi:hypothetical protein
MKGAPRAGAPRGADRKTDQTISSTSASPRQNHDHFELPPNERSLTVAVWWRMRREGVKLPAEKGVIVIEGGLR